jgi:hypothetical protein
MSDQTIQLMIWKLVQDPDGFTIGEIDELTIALRRRDP